MEDLLQIALKAAHKGQNYAFATIVEATGKGTPRKAGAKMVVLEDGTIYGTIGGGRYEKEAQKECLRAIRSQKSILLTYEYFGRKGQGICGGQMRVFVEPFVTRKHLIICGAGHIALPLSALAKILDFKVTIIDNRKEFANKRRFPHVDKVIAEAHAKRLVKIPINSGTFIMIVTHGHEYDFDCLKAVIKSEASYIGVIASLTKRVKFLRDLRRMGVSNKFLKMVQIPAGIDIGAQTPQEIAVSIMAEIVAKSNIELIGSKKFKQKNLK